MIKINLLPTETLKKRSQKDLIVVGSIAGVLVALLIAGSFLQRKFKLGRLTKEVKIAQSELEKYRNIVNQVEALKSEKARLEQRRNVIRSLLSGRLLYPKLMDSLIASIPREIWLKSCNTTSSDMIINLDMTASSLSNFAIADWITTLEDSKEFSNVTLGTINTTQIKTAGSQRSKIVLDFSIKFTYKGS